MYLAYKTGHVVDLETENVLRTEVYTDDTDAPVASAMKTQANLNEAAVGVQTEKAVADKGANTLELTGDLNV